MAHYRKVDTRIWNDEKFCTLSTPAKLAFMFVMTHPQMTSLGAMRGTVAGLSAELSVKKSAYDQILKLGLIYHDPKSHLIWLPNFLRYNPPESPNAIKGWATALELLPECALRHALVERAWELTEGLPLGWRKEVAKVFGKTWRIQEQEQEQDTKTHTHSATDGDPPIEPDEPPAPTESDGTLKAGADTFAPCAASRTMCADYRLDFDLELANFRDNAKMNGRICADWQAAFRKWIRDSHVKARNASATQRASPITRYASSSQRNSANIRQVLAEVGADDDPTGSDETHGNLGGNVRRAGVGT